MAEDEEGLEFDENGKPGGKSKKKLVIIILALLIVVGGGGAGAYFMGLIGGEEPATEELAEGEELPDESGEESSDEESEKSEASSDEGPIYYQLPEFLVNLNTGGKGVSFLKAVIILEVKNQAVADKIQKFEPRIIDGFNTYLLELRSSDLVGSAGLYRLREEMLLRVNKEIYPDKLENILFKEIIVQ